MLKKKILQKALSDGILANLRPLYNSNVAKVYIVKWSQIQICVAGSVISGISTFLGFQYYFKIIGQAKKGVSVHNNPILRPLYDRYFCHISIIKWFQICQNSIKKNFFGEIFCFAFTPMYFPLKPLEWWRGHNFRPNIQIFLRSLRNRPLQIVAI